MKNEFLKEIVSYKDEERAAHCQRFFKTAKGQYGEGDVFMGIMSAQNRALAKKYYKNLSLSDLEDLLQNEYHEIRVCALLMAVLQYEKGDEIIRKKIFDFYLRNTDRINNWDLVDLTAPNIVGHYVYNYSDTDVLRELAKSGYLWSERISIVAALYFIRQKDFEYITSACEYFLSHRHDLIHKACGWMLREAGKKDVSVLETFLNKNTLKMPRTMLRYSIEKFPEEKRKKYLLMKA